MATSATTTGLLVALLVLVIISASCVGALWYLRRVRRAREGILPQYSEKGALSPRNSHHKRVSAAVVSPTTQAGLFAAAEKSPLSATSAPVTPANLPAIHVTFPEEVGSDGKRMSGRVVVVHMDDKGGVGMAPVHPEDQPPAYTTDGRFVSLDLERIGGLKEKERPAMPPAA